MEPVNVCELKREEFKKFLDSFDHVFSDCDGVIWSSKTPYPQVGKFYELIKKLGKTVHYVSNNSLRNKENYDNNFKMAEIENGFDHLTIPSKAIAEYLKSVNMKKKVYCVTCVETINILKSYGFQCETGPELPADYLHDFVQYLQDDDEIGAVVFDSDFKVNLAKLYKASTYLRRPEVLFVAGATDRSICMKPGLVAIGTGVFTDIVADKVERVPVLLGKPGKEFGEFAMKQAGFTDASRVLFIGDMIEQDIGLGKIMGFKTLLVLNSITKEDMLSHPTIKPDYFAKDLGNMVPLLFSLAKGENNIK